MEGAAEQNIISLASGMAQEGLIPYVNTIATFLTRRCYEQICIDLGLLKTKVRLIANGGGMVYAPLGPTHLATDDIALMRSVPNMTILVPADEIEVAKMIKNTVSHPGPIYFRIAKGGDPVVTKNIYKKFEIGKPYKIGKEKKNIIITTGIMLDTAMKIRQHFKKLNYELGVIHCPTIKPINSSSLFNLLSKTSNIITIEEHSVIGGLGSTINDLITRKKFKKVENIGIPDEFPKGYGRQHNMMTKYNLDLKSLIKKIKKIIS
tara:strand:- start:1004 stop:1792 length:789 start_codon:yes stop_codon:yes gene_type:complete